MESGEKEMRKVFEDVTTGNVKTVLAHANETRKIVRDLEDRMAKLESLIRNQDSIIESLKIQLAGIQTKIFSGGT